MASDGLDGQLETCRASWAGDGETQVLALPGPKDPVVAVVDGDPRVLHSGRVYAASVTAEEIREWCASRDGAARVAPLSEFGARFDRGHFEDRHPAEVVADGE